MAGTGWQTRAACHDTDPDLFFPATDDDTSLTTTRARITIAPLCRACPVATECLRWALDTGQDYGLWAATTPTDRRAIRRALGTPAPTTENSTREDITPEDAA
ncbi:WhiB family transcriptional regulator [Actinomycetospora sp. CA-101289]|uniref:WhiB family transcriptional regulator n=1 Tax=Actinomycetospora sp. CA-101289 TaxID=3239893 RepID=UPI003D98CADB